MLLKRSNIKWMDECERMDRNDWQYDFFVSIIKIGRTGNWMK